MFVNTTTAAESTVFPDIKKKHYTTVYIIQNAVMHRMHRMLAVHKYFSLKEHLKNKKNLPWVLILAQTYPRLPRKPNPSRDTVPFAHK